MHKLWVFLAAIALVGCGQSDSETSSPAPTPTAALNVELEDSLAKNSLRSAATVAVTQHARTQTYAGLLGSFTNYKEVQLQTDGVGNADAPVSGPLADPTQVVAGTGANGNQAVAERGAVNELVLCAASRAGKVFCLRLDTRRQALYYTIAPGDATPTWSQVPPLVAEKEVPGFARVIGSPGGWG